LTQNDTANNISEVRFTLCVNFLLKYIIFFRTNPSGRIGASGRPVRGKVLSCEVCNDTQAIRTNSYDRNCDGGISISLRKCLSKAECVGNVERFKICNMQVGVRRPTPYD